jgi:hypothetical protein
MPVLSYIPHLFNAEQCHASIHTLQWQDRSLQCPRCQSQDVDPWGTYHYRPGCKRYWCNGCQRTCNDLTHTLLHQSRRMSVFPAQAVSAGVAGHQQTELILQAALDPTIAGRARKGQFVRHLDHFDLLQTARN